MIRFGLVGSVFLLMVEGTVGAASQVPSAQAASNAMSKFLHAWLVEQTRESALSHISGSIRSQEVAPRSVWIHKGDSPGLSEEQKAAYWEVLKKFAPLDPEWQELAPLDPEWQDEPTSLELDSLELDSLKKILVPLDPDLENLLDRHANVVMKDPFIILVADTDEVIDSFDAGYGDVAKALQPHENQVLAMIADFKGRRRNDTGPFVSFWSEDEEDDVWLLQALGAIPHDPAWLDDGR